MSSSNNTRGDCDGLSDILVLSTYTNVMGDTSDTSHHGNTVDSNHHGDTAEFNRHGGTPDSNHDCNTTDYVHHGHTADFNHYGDTADSNHHGDKTNSIHHGDKADSNHHGDHTTTCIGRLSNSGTLPSAEQHSLQDLMRKNSCSSDQEEFGEFCFSPSITPGESVSCVDTKKKKLVNVEICSRVIVARDKDLTDSSLKHVSVRDHIGNGLIQNNLIATTDITNRSVNTVPATDMTDCSLHAHSECVHNIDKSMNYRCDHNVYKTCDKLNGFYALNRHNNFTPSVTNDNQTEDKELENPGSSCNPCVEGKTLYDFTETSSERRTQIDSVENNRLPITINHDIPSDLTIDDYCDDFDDFKTADVKSISASESAALSSDSASFIKGEQGGSVADEQGVMDGSNWAVFDDQSSSTSFGAGLNSEKCEYTARTRGDIEDFAVSREVTPPITQNVLSADVVIKTIKDSFLQEEHCPSSIVVTSELPSFTEVMKETAYHPPPVLSSSMSDDVVWNGMNVLENTAALKHHWAGSHTQALVLRALKVNPSNILTKAKTTGATLLTRGK